LSIFLIAFSLALSPITISITCRHRRMNSIALQPIRVAHSLILACSRGLILIVIRSLLSMTAIVSPRVSRVKDYFNSPRFSFADVLRIWRSRGFIGS